MIDEHFQAAMEYLSAPAGPFWKWADNGRVVVWNHGATVAWREELTTILRRLSPRGLPPLDAVILLIAATRPNWKESSESLRTALARSNSLIQVLTSSTQIPVNGLDVLNNVRRLPADLLVSVESKAALAEIVFATARPVVTAEVAKIACDILSQELIDEHRQIPNLQLLHGGSVQTVKSLSQTLRLLANGLDGLTDESLRYQLQTGLDDEPVAAEVEVPTEPSAVQTLLSELALDDELSGLCRIARNLSAVLQLPRAISDSDELPLGGVSDIVNRGSLDRLLLSELANEDLLLATRVALNEALYLRREAPPSQPPQRRHVLVDSGLRMWGVPRVFATATMLALAANGTARSSLVAYRASEDRAIPIDPTSRAGLSAHLEALEPDVHPGRALLDFFRRVELEDLPGDVVLVTSDATWADPDFQRELSNVNPPAFFIAAVNRAGEFQLWMRAARGTKCLTKLKLDLDALLKPSRPGARLVDASIDPELPAIFRTSPFPFRLPCNNSNKEVVWSVPLTHDRIELLTLPGNDGQPVLTASDTGMTSKPAIGAMILCRDRRLIFFDDRQRGGLQIADGVPFGPVLWSGSSSDRHLNYALIHRYAEPAFYLIVINVVLNRLVATKKLNSNYLSHSGPGCRIQGATSHLGIVYVIYQSVVEAFDLAEGRLLDQIDIHPQWKWRGRRFFSHTHSADFEEWYALTFGASAKFEPIRLHGMNIGPFLTMFDRIGHDGPYGVTNRGMIFNLSDGSKSNVIGPVSSNLQVLDVDDVGNRLLISHDNVRQILHMDPNTHLDYTRQTHGSLAQHDLTTLNLGGTLKHRFSRVLVGADGTLTFVSKTQNHWQFQVYGRVLQMRRCQSPAHLRAQVNMEQSKSSQFSHGTTVAEFEDGSRILIDSRGIMHLQSSDRSIPEMSLVLNETNVAAWISDGRVCGLPYFVDAPYATSIEPDEIIETVLKPFIWRLR